MTSRINARHTTCPGCQEEVFLDELVGGRCPLCGCALEEDEACDEFEDGLDRTDLAWLVFHYFIFKKFDDLGVSPLQIMQLISNYSDDDGDDEGDLSACTGYALDLPMRTLDRIRPKRCAKCGRVYIGGGKKVIAGDLRRPGHDIQYICPRC